MTSPTTRGVWKHDEVALLLIDYQPEMFRNIASATPADVVALNTQMLVRTAKAFDIPIVLSTVGVEMKVNSPTRESIAAELPGVPVIDRSSMNAWDDAAFRKAVVATGKKKLIFGALYTEICLAYPVEDALKDGFDAAIVVDAVGGMSELAHATAISRLMHAGAVPNTTAALVCELFRDWKTAEGGKVRPIFDWYWSELKQLAAK